MIKCLQPPRSIAHPCRLIIQVWWSAHMIKEVKVLAINVNVFVDESAMDYTQIGVNRRVLNFEMVPNERLSLQTDFFFFLFLPCSVFSKQSKHMQESMHQHSPQLKRLKSHANEPTLLNPQLFNLSTTNRQIFKCLIDPQTNMKLFQHFSKRK